MADGSVEVLVVPDLTKFARTLRADLSKLEGTTRVDLGVGIRAGAATSLKAQVQQAASSATASGATDIKFTANAAAIRPQLYTRVREAVARASSAALVNFKAVTGTILSAVGTAVKIAATTAERFARIVFLPITSGIVPAVVSATRNAVAAAQAQLATLQASAVAAGATITRRLTLPILAIGGLAIKTGVDFESAMLRVQGLTKATATEFEALEKTAKDLGRTTQFSASEAADAMGFLAQAGFEADEIVGALPDTLNLAASANLDLASSADIVSNIMSGYGVDVEDLGFAVDVLAAAFSSTNTDLTQLGEAFKKVGPVANNIGVEINTTAAAIGALSDAGIQGGDAGTAFRNVLLKLLNPTNSAQKVIDRLGVSVYDSEGNMRDIIDIMEDFGNAGLDASDASEIFGLRTAAAAVILADTAGDIRESAVALNDQGRAAELAAIQMSGARGSLLRMKSAIEAVVIAITQAGVLDAVAGLAEKIATLASRAAEASPAALALGTKIALAAAAFGPAVSILGRFLLPLRAVLAVISLLLSPLALLAVVAAAVGAAVAINLLPGFNNWEDISRDLVDLFANRLVPAIISVAEAAVRFASSIDWIGILNTVGGALAEFVGWVRSAWMAFLFPEEGITNSGIAADVEKFAIIARGVFDQVAGFVADTLIPALVSIGQFMVDEVLPRLGDLASFVKDTVLPALLDLGTFIIDDVLPPLGDLAGFIVDTIIPALAEFVAFDLVPFLVDFAAGVAEVVMALADGVVAVTGWLDQVGLVEPILIGLAVAAGVFAAAWAVQMALVLASTIAGFAPLIAIGLGIAAVVAGVVYAYQNFALFRTVVDALWKAIKVAATFIADVAVAVFRHLADESSTTRQVLGVLVDIFTTLGKTVGKVVATEFKIVVRVVKTFIAAIKGIISVGKKVIDFFKDLIDGITDIVDAVKDFEFGDAFETAFNAVMDFITGWIDEVVDFFTELPGQIVDALGDIGSTIWDGIVTGFEFIVSSIAKWADDVVLFFITLPLRATVAMAQLTGLILGTLVGGLALILTKIAGWALDFLTYFITLPGKVVNAVGDIGSFLWNALSSGFQNIISSLASWASDVIQFFIDLPGDAVNAIGDIGSALWDAVQSGFQTFITNAGNVVSDVIQFFIDLPGDIVSTVGDIGTTLWDAITTGFETLKTNISNAVSSIVGFFDDLITEDIPRVAVDMYEAALDLGGKFLSGLIDGISGAVGFVVDVGKAFANAVIDGMNRVIEEINDALEFTIPTGPLFPDIPINPPDIPPIPRLFHGKVFGRGDGPQLATFNEPGNPEAVVPYGRPAAALRILTDRRLHDVVLRAAEQIQGGRSQGSGSPVAQSAGHVWNGDVIIPGANLPENPANIGIVIGNRVHKGVARFMR